MSSAAVTLKATIRPLRGKGPARQIRMKGGVPAEVYGLGEANQSVVVDGHDLGMILRAGKNQVIALDIDGTKQLTLCRQVDRHPVKTTLTHVDFIRVKADQEIGAEVALVLTGEPHGVAMGGMLEQLLHSLSITAKPSAIPTEISHDVSALVLGGQLHVSDIVAPKGVTIASESDGLVALIAAPRGAAAETGDDAAGDAAPAEKA